MKKRWFLNDDLSINILSRLSSKTLHSLKYVSKDWFNLINGRSFIRIQLKRKDPLSGFFFQEIFQWTDNDDMDSISYIPLKPINMNVWRTVLNFLPESVLILSSTNGLLCCRSCFPTPFPKLYICNPLNKQWTSLDWPNLSRSSSVALAFDPLQNPIDASTDFKLVVVSHVEDEEKEDCFLFDIYSSKLGLWRRSSERCRCDDYLTKNKGVFADGILYWLTDDYQILMFDPENEFSWLVKTPLPETEFRSIPEMCIGESEGKLCYVIISEDGLQLWVLEDHFSSQWGLKISMSLEELEKANPRVLCNLAPKVARRLCKDNPAWMDPLALQDGMLLLRVSANIYLYEFEMGSMKKLCDISTLGPKAMFSPIVVPYAMSLVPLDQA